MNKLLLGFFGLWPYQSNFTKRRNYLIFVVSIVLGVLPMAQGLTEEFSEDIVVIFETVVGIAIIVGSFAQYTTMHAKDNWLKRLYHQIDDDWKATTDPDELAILETFNRQGKLLTFVYMATVAAAYSCFVVLNYLPLLFDKNHAKNYSKIFPYYANSWIINDDWRNLQVFVHLVLEIVYFGLIYVLMIGIYMHSVKHACGMYAIVGFKLRKLLEKSDNASLTANNDDRIIPELIEIVTKHKAAMRCTRIIGNIFNEITYFMHIGVLITLALLIFDVTFNIKSTLAIFRIIFVAIIIMEYILYMNYGGELIIEFSNKVLMETSYTNWNLMSIRARKMLLMIMCRSTKPEKFRIGGMVLSLENFAMIVKLSWSLAAALMSTQKKLPTALTE